MIPIAGVLLLIIVAFSVAVVVSNPEVFNLSIFGASIPVTTAGVYFTGAGAMLVLVLTAALLRRGLKREMTRRKQVRALQSAAGVKRLPTSGPGAAPKGTKPTDSRAQPTSEVASQKATGQNQAKSSPEPSGVTVAAGSAGSPGTVQPAPSTPGNNPGSTSDRETTAAERQALLDEAQELTGDSADR